MAPLSRRRLLVTAAGAAALGLGMPLRARTRMFPSAGRRAWAQAMPEFSDVSAVEPEEALLFLAGRHPRYPGANLDSLMGFSPADILETMDTVVLDSVYRLLGGESLVALYRMIALHLLESLLAVYEGAPVVLALDAGHGGKRGVYYDPGSNGTEAAHARQVVVAVEERAGDPRNASITLRRIFNDEIGDDFGLPPPEDRKSAASLTMRNARAAMLAYKAARWNAEHGAQSAEPAGGDGEPPSGDVAVHVVSVHFNANSGGILVLHQGDAVPEGFREWSVAFARAYVASARAALNASGLLPYPLSLALGTGLSDDHLLYEPPMRLPSRVNPYTGVDRSRFPRRYAMLQASLHQRDYADGALRYRGLT
jgi:hypothetical protein